MSGIILAQDVFDLYYMLLACSQEDYTSPKSMDDLRDLDHQLGHTETDVDVYPKERSREVWPKKNSKRTEAYSNERPCPLYTVRPTTIMQLNKASIDISGDWKIEGISIGSVLLNQILL